MASELTAVCRGGASASGIGILDGCDPYSIGWEVDADARYPLLVTS